MKIIKAIDLLRKDLDDPGSVDITDLNQAQELGIEALNHIAAWRNDNDDDILWDLPGEEEQ